MKEGDLLILQYGLPISTLKKGERFTFVRETYPYWEVRRYITGVCYMMYPWRFMPDILTEDEFIRIYHLNKP